VIVKPNLNIMLPNNFRTGIKELDKMLGSTGIPPQNIIIIKGGPGSGKTTLGIQIINNHLKYENCNAGFISLEVDNKIVLSYAKQNFGFSNLDQENLFVTSSDSLRKTIKDYFDPEKSHLELSKALINNLKNGNTHIENNNSYKTILFFDSLNILIDTIQSSIQEISENEISRREIIKSICRLKNGDQDSFENTIFIFSVEYHPSNFEVNSLISESFLCDTEILLNIEPIHGAIEKSANDISTLGYKIESNSEGGKTNEFRSFCRILKTRFSNHESRRCAYDIREEQGLKFYETYPGDGLICLFNENERQKAAWDVFFNDAIPNQFPALRFNKFERNSLQQNFSTRRRFLYMPEKTDLYLASFDNYWVNWYIDVVRKWNIQDIIENKSIIYTKYYNNKKGQDTQNNTLNLTVFINNIHSILTKSLLKYSIPAPIEISNYLILDEGDKNNNWLSIEYLGEELKISINDIKVKEDDYYLKIKANRILSVVSLGYISHSGRKEIKFKPKCDLNIMGNIEGMIIIAEPKNDDGTKSERMLFFANYAHHKIEFKTEEVEKDIIIFDNIYKVVYKSNEEHENVTPQKHNFNTSCIINGEIISLKLSPEGNVIIPKNTPQYDCLNDIINEFREMDRKRLIDDIFKVLSSEPSKKCFECQNIRNLLKKLNDNVLDNIEFSNCKDLICKLNNEINLNNEADKSIKLKKETIYLSLLELTIDKYYQCFHENTEGKIDLRSIEFNASGNIGVGRKCRWEKSIDEVMEWFCIRHNTKKLKKEKIIEHIKTNLFDVFNSKIQNDLDELKAELKINDQNFDLDLNYDILRIYISLTKKKESKSFFIPVDKKEIRLSGEKKSEIISELSAYSFDDNRPFHLENFLFSMRNFDKYITIPYDANVGIFIYKKNVLSQFYKNLKENLVDKLKYRQIVIDIYNNQGNLLKRIINPEQLELLEKDKKNYKQLEDLIDRSIYDTYPKTWEEIFAIYHYYREKGQDYKCIIETQTYDTYLSNYLEILWNCGGDLCIKPDYKIVYENENKQYFLQALYLYAYMFYSGLVPEASTLEVEKFSEQFEKGENKEKNEEWLFMRQYYSTFVELLTSKRENPKTNKIEFIWTPPMGTEIGLMPMPVSLSKYLKEDNPYKVKHCTCWGDWHFGILKGSENVSLGVELINHLMSSHKIVDRAFSNANLPTTEQFYTLYKNANCFNINERSDIKMPTTTYQELRNKYFSHARSRSQVFDYRHCMREIHSVLKFTEQIALRNKSDNNPTKLPGYILNDIHHQLKNALKAIESFKNKGILNY
jgi:RecA/RadA recombinase